MNSPTEVISCTMVVQLPTGVIQSHTRTGLSLGGLWTSQRSQVRVVTLNTLLTVLRMSIGSAGTPPMEQQFISFLTLPEASPEIGVATSRVPDFALDSIQKPTNGYRYLGLLADVDFAFSMPSATWNPCHDILAVHEIGENPDTRNFLRAWEPCGVNLATHFIIIFTHPPPAHVQHSSPLSYAGELFSRRNTPVSAHASSGAQTPISTTGMDGLDSASDLFDFLQTGLASTNDPTTPANMDTPSQMFNFLQTGLTSTDNPTTPADTSVPSQTTSHSTEVARILSAMDGSNNLLNICTALHISEVISVEPARFKEVNSKQDDSLLVMVQNHQAMSQLLVSLGQPGYTEDPHGKSVTTYAGGLTVSTKNILIELGWTQMSYSHKSDWYKWAADAATASWSGEEALGFCLSFFPTKQALNFLFPI